MNGNSNDSSNGGNHFAAGQPDAFDRAYGQAQGFPHTRESTVTAANVLGVGGVRQYIVQTFRVPEHGDMVFVTITGPEGLMRVHLPAKVSGAIASQREALSKQTRIRRGRELAHANKVATGHQAKSKKK